MKDLMEYKGYYGSAHYDDDDRIFNGRVEYIRSLVSYEADAAKRLRKAFEDTVKRHQLGPREKKGPVPRYLRAAPDDDNSVPSIGVSIVSVHQGVSRVKVNEDVSGARRTSNVNPLSGAPAPAVNNQPKPAPSGPNMPLAA